jgi:hypothetical protein
LKKDIKVQVWSLFSELNPIFASKIWTTKVATHNSHNLIHKERDSGEQSKRFFLKDVNVLTGKLFPQN